MSLLMDALKKAEREKKEAGQRLRDARGKDTEELRLADKEEPVKKSGTPTQSQQDPESADIGENLSLAPKEKDDDTLELPQMGDDSGIDFAQVTGEHEITNTGDTEEKEDEIATEDLEASRDTDTIDITASEESTLPAEEKEEEKVPERYTPPDRDMDRTFALTTEDTEEGRPIPELEKTKKEEPTSRLDTSDRKLSRSIISAAELAQDIGTGKGRPTPVAAQTVFTAVAGKSDQGRLYRWGVFTLLCMIIAVAIGVFYYLSISPMTPAVTPSQVARSAELDPVVSVDIDKIRETAGRAVSDSGEKMTQGELIGETVSDAGETVATVVQEPVAVEVPAEEDVQEQAQDKAAKLTVAETTVETTGAEKEANETGTDTELKTDTEMNVDTVAATGGETESGKILPERIRVDPEVIQISRSKGTDEESKLVSSAYQDYVAGRYQAARLKYQAALSEMPENPDALLGVAASEYRQGNLRTAYEYYLRVMKLYPDNRYARAALINLQQGQDLSAHASTLKVLIQQEPKSSYLYFSLGNLYAAQSRWPEAQQAFFDAYRLDPDNPDYAFNLAVSLDRIGQGKSALGYYRTALQLAENVPVAFDTSRALSRMQALISSTGKTE